MTLSLQRPSLLRWCAGGLIAALSVLQALRTLAVPGRAASLGGVAIFALAALTVAGMWGLLRARLRIERELLAMRHEPPGGALIGARRARLAHVAAQGARLDLDALAEEAAAGERGRAYLGRYLVAVAVLIGLVGTFSGLADALRALPAIFNGASADPARLAELMRSAMSGLDLTFAAGIVGILSTLALALVQGDLQVHEERALARLEEVTAHELVPALWPRRSEDRVVEELVALRDEAASVRILVGEASQSLGAGVAEALRAGLVELRAHQAETMRALGLSLTETTEKLALRMSSLTDEVGARALVTHDVIVQLGGEAAQQLGDAARAFTATTRDELVAAREALASAAQRQVSALEAAIEGQRQLTTIALEAQTAAMSTAVAGQTAAMPAASAAHTQAIAESSVEQRAVFAAALEAQQQAIDTTVHVQAAAISAAAESQAAAISAAAESQAATLASTATRQAEALSTAFAQQHALVTTQIAEQRAQLTGALEGQQHALSAALTAQSATIVAASAAQAEALSTQVSAHQEAIADAAERQAEAVERAMAGLVEASLGAFAAPAAQLSDAATSLADAQRALAPQLETLTPELRALTTEVALLGARAEQEAEPPLFADELVRLGEGMSRLEALVQLSQQGGKRQGARG